MKNIKIAGMKLQTVLLIAVVIIIAIWLGVLPEGMIGAFLFLMIFGEILNLIGNKLPIIKTFFGGGPIVVILVGSFLVYKKILPAKDIESISTFMDSGGFLDFYIAALITGSILGMNRKLLIKASVRYLPCILGGVAAALGLVAIFAGLAGYSPSEAIAYIGIPIMGGGMGAGAVPISKVFESALNIPAKEILSRLVPAVALGNAMAIVAGGLLDKIGKVKPTLTGNGQLMRVDDKSLTAEVKGTKPMELIDYGKGIIVATAFFTFGAIVSGVLKNGIGPIKIDIHTYAWMIVTVAIAKATNVVPESLQEACAGWYQFVAKNFTAALLLGIGIGYTNRKYYSSAITTIFPISIISNYRSNFRLRIYRKIGRFLSYRSSYNSRIVYG